MDQDIYELNRTFLLKARECAMAYGDHRAHCLLGISLDLASFLRRISLSQLNALAEANITCFSVRVPASTLRQMESILDDEHLDDFGRCQILVSTLRWKRDAH